MTHSSPTALAVADAIDHYRRLRLLTRDELSYVLAVHDYHLSSDQIAAIENLEREVSVDDLTALAHALDVSPAALLSHAPRDMPILDQKVATGIPADVSLRELHDWVRDRTSLESDARVQWWTNEVARLRVISAHHEEQLSGAIIHQGELEDQHPADENMLIEVQHRIHEGEFDQNQADVALAIAEQQLDDLRETCL